MSQEAALARLDIDLDHAEERAAALEALAAAERRYIERLRQFGATYRHRTGQGRDGRQWLRLAAVVQATGLSESTIRRRCQDGTLPYRLLGGAPLFDQAEVDAFIAQDGKAARRARVQ